MANVSTAFVGLAALFWGLSGGIGGILMADGWEPFVVAFYRGAIGLVFVLGWLALRPRGSGLACGRLWFWSLIAGLGVAGNFAFYFVSISEGSVAIAATLMYCAPVFVYLVSFALRLERPSALKWVAIALVLLGVVLLTETYEAGAAEVSVIGVLAGLLSGLSYAVFIFGFKYASGYGSPPAILAIAFSALAAVLIWPADADQALSAVRSTSLALFVTLGVLGAGLSFILYIGGLYYTPAAVASIVAMVEPVVASLFGVAVLSERLDGLQVTGMVLIVVTVTALSVRSSGRWSPKTEPPTE
jgi:drug/metabolite transporter (DMT)-like permease